MCSSAVALLVAFFSTTLGGGQRVLLQGLSGNPDLKQQGISTNALLLVHFRKHFMKQLLSEIKVQIESI